MCRHAHRPPLLSYLHNKGGVTQNISGRGVPKVEPTQPTHQAPPPQVGHIHEARTFRHWQKKYEQLAESVVRNAKEKPAPPGTIMSALLSLTDPETGPLFTLPGMNLEVFLACLWCKLRRWFVRYILHVLCCKCAVLLVKAFVITAASFLPLLLQLGLMSLSYASAWSLQALVALIHHACLQLERLKCFCNLLPGKKLTDAQLKAEVGILLIAGFETTAHSIA
eukprot:1159453-Pelagomonas_calceolata.AAC.1